MITNKKEHLKKVKDKLISLNMEFDIESILKLAGEIIDIKEEKKAIILGHNYMSPDVFWGVSDVYGDSLALAKAAVDVEAEIILFNGVHFMAETAKILNPQKKVLIADIDAGCSLAESITAEQVREFKSLHPNCPVVTYINCSAEVKAESDIICTSANAVKVVNSLKEDKVIVLPDAYLASNIQKETDKELIIWEGKCMVHELFSVVDVDMVRKHHPDIKIIAHPECRAEVTQACDYTGSTSQMGSYLETEKPKEVLLLTECSMSENLQPNFPNVNFIGLCQACPHMKKITLEKVKKALLEEKFEIHVKEDIRIKAKKSLDAMLSIGR